MRSVNLLHKRKREKKRRRRRRGKRTYDDRWLVKIVETCKKVKVETLLILEELMQVRVKTRIFHKINDGYIKSVGRIAIFEFLVRDDTFLTKTIYLLLSSSIKMVIRRDEESNSFFYSIDEWWSALKAITLLFLGLNRTISIGDNHVRFCIQFHLNEQKTMREFLLLEDWWHSLVGFYPFAKYNKEMMVQWQHTQRYLDQCLTDDIN